MKAAIKRGQSHACMSYAERKQARPKVMSDVGRAGGRRELPALLFINVKKGYERKKKQEE